MDDLSSNVKISALKLKDPKIQYEKLCLDAIPIIKGVGEFIRKESTRQMREQIEMKGRNDIVTYVDKTSQQMLVEKLGELLPGSGFIAEEDITTDSKGEYVWIIDPLDGTTNFVYSIPIYSISVALMHNDKIVAAVVYEINKSECFYAYLNGGAYLNGSPITVSATVDIDAAILATGIPHSNFAKKKQYFECLADLVEWARGIRRLGSAAVDLCYVACGRFDIYFEVGLSPWDVAAGALIVEEAGGKVDSFDNKGDFLYGKTIMCGNKMIFRPFSDVIRKYFGN